MDIRYVEWNDDLQTRDDLLEELTRLFTFILLKTSGDVDEALEWMDYLNESHDILQGMSMQELIDHLKRQGIIRDDAESGEKYMLTGKGEQKIRRDALEQIFTSLKKGGTGEHRTPHPGLGSEFTGDVRDFAFGDQSSAIEPTETLTNALRREADLDRFSLREEDIRVQETEHVASTSTVVMLDISHSMILYGEDRITPAKQVVLALTELIMTRYPKDRLHVVLFGDDAQEVGINDLPYVTVGPYHTNTRAGLRLARSLLRKTPDANRQIFMVTDGKPSAIYDDVGRLYTNSFGLDPMIVNKTLDEAVACRRERIPITTFMVARDPYLVNFVEDLTKANSGRAYYTGLGKLGEMVLVDYIRNRKRSYR
jgi:uncharacterized protein with von Willebrand factor type A (vWA) domain